MYLRIGKWLDADIDDDTLMLMTIIVGVFAFFGGMILFIPK